MCSFVYRHTIVTHTHTHTHTHTYIHTSDIHIVSHSEIDKPSDQECILIGLMVIRLFLGPIIHRLSGGEARETVLLRVPLSRAYTLMHLCRLRVIC